MRLSSWLILALGLASSSGCGGGEERPVTSSPPVPTSGAQPSPGGAAAPGGGTNAATTGAPQAETPAAPAPKMPPMDLQPAEPPPAPATMPKVTISTPKANEVVPADKANDYEVNLEVKDWPVAKDGPHVHLILDNKPYKAIFEPKAKVKLSEIVEGEAIAEGQHVLVAFPSSDKHISVKPAGGKAPFTVVTFWVGKKGTATWKPTDPTLIYSRPKGDYSGADVDRIVLDYYLLNAELGDKKYSVKATVTPPSGEAKTITMTTWAPYAITSLPQGETKVELELLDKDGKSVPGSLGFNKTSRSIKVDRGWKK